MQNGCTPSTNHADNDSSGKDLSSISNIEMRMMHFNHSKIGVQHTENMPNHGSVNGQLATNVSRENDENEELPSSSTMNNCLSGTTSDSRNSNNKTCRGNEAQVFHDVIANTLSNMKHSISIQPQLRTARTVGTMAGSVAPLHAINNIQQASLMQQHLNNEDDSVRTNFQALLKSAQTDYQMQPTGLFTSRNIQQLRALPTGVQGSDPTQNRSSLLNQNEMLSQNLTADQKGGSDASNQLVNDNDHFKNCQNGNLTQNNNNNNNNPRKPPTYSSSGCTCKKSKCLKLYCQCFASSALCNPDKCVCTACENRPGKEKEIEEAKSVILERNPRAFENKFRSETTTRDWRHQVALSQGRGGVSAGGNVNHSFAKHMSGPGLNVCKFILFSN